MQLRNEPELSSHRHRCYTCYRPVASCFCDAIPSIDNQTHVLILQHVKERFHAFNTARIVRQALKHSTLIVDQTTKLATRELPFMKNTGVLYPGPEARLLSDVPPDERPDQIVVLDGTWHHAKTFVRQIPALQDLPRFSLQPAAPSNYRIRKEPTETAISTLEATVEALRMLEPDTQGLDQLLRAFDTMIDAQVEHPQQAGRLRLPKRASRSVTNIPHVLLDDIDNVVVTYGEASHGRNNARGPQQPVYWVAQRLGTGESFECPIQSWATDEPYFLDHLKLQRSDFESAKSLTGFRDAWNRFLRPSDTIAVFNESTTRLLSSVEAPPVSSVTLKAVDLPCDVTTLDEIMVALNLVPPAVIQKGRAGRRLANAIALTQYLHKLGTSEQ